MFLKRKGFTLIELIIAAAIVGALAVFATQTFRHSASDIRVQDAKNRAKVIAMAARRMQFDIPGVSFTSEVLANPASARDTANGSCVAGDAILSNVNLQTMVNCGYLEYRKYLDPNFQFQFNGAEVCVKINPEGSKVFGGADDTFCTNGDTSVGTGAFE